MSARPCGGCRHLDGRTVGAGVSYCWRLAVWRAPDDPGCAASERADGSEPPARTWFLAHRTKDQPA